MDWFTELFAFLFGTAIGSFANVCIYRMPHNLSVVFPRSACTRCGSRIAWYDNLPLLSYLLLRGQCRRCGVRYGSRYFWVELSVGLLALALVHFRGIEWQTVYFFVFGAALIVISLIDLDYRIIPDAISLPAIAVGLLMAGFTTWIDADWPVTLQEAALGALLGGGLLWGVGWLYEKITGREGIGFGDVKLLAAFGAHFGIPGVLTSLFYGSFLGSLVGVILILALRKGRRYPIPFGPFLCLGLGLHVLGGATWLQRFF